MRIIIPMAGQGSRLRPHTLSTPKPLIPVAGKPIVQWLVEQIICMISEPVEEIAYIIGDFDDTVKKRLLEIAKLNGSKGKIYHQNEALGTAHAILCAGASIKDHVIIAFADTLFKADFKIDTQKDGIIWVNKVDDPSQFGIVKLDGKRIIRELVEKPEKPESDLAVIGIYFFNDGTSLKNRLQYLIDHDIREKGEYQITSAMQNMMNDGQHLYAENVDLWLDCGNKNAVLNTNRKLLELYGNDPEMQSNQATINQSVIIPPCFIASGVQIENSVIGPYVSIEENSKINNSVIRDSLIMKGCTINNKLLNQSMLSQQVSLGGIMDELSLGANTKTKY